ncbi:hypothetical protein [Riemerella anatipestifer]|uniref:hypothetical protein n=1 Tax=Riemerella anatipestifer TaxID=34085 RepID=UPI00208EDD7D|nr:hypothetical protein [Riemerella anatipestifer]MCO4303712.1 hypothetical protein [Riemerella anatipestifer]MCO7352105.1 hypothetical protein [Riemerella anatipestifer]MCQ4039720.1 hypothetical protein [Riemerella anatipestifer]MCT6760618.1 hypothetical protein [Riemerella anatipestifer]MCT6764310.1 hypothetical protein [Riemerella anatipestifer]
MTNNQTKTALVVNCSNEVQRKVEAILMLKRVITPSLMLLKDSLLSMVSESEPDELYSIAETQAHYYRIVQKMENLLATHQPQYLLTDKEWLDLADSLADISLANRQVIGEVQFLINTIHQSIVKTA